MQMIRSNFHNDSQITEKAVYTQPLLPEATNPLAIITQHPQNPQQFVCYVRSFSWIKLCLDLDLHMMIYFEQVFRYEEEFWFEFSCDQTNRIFIVNRLKEISFNILTSNKVFPEGNKLLIHPIQKYLDTLCLVTDSLNAAVLEQQDIDYTLIQEMILAEHCQQLREYEFEIQPLTCFIELPEWQDESMSISGLLKLILHHLEVEIFFAEGTNQYYIRTQSFYVPVIILSRCLRLSIHGRFISEKTFQLETKNLQKFTVDENLTQSDEKECQRIQLQKKSELKAFFWLVFSEGEDSQDEQRTEGQEQFEGSTMEKIN